MKAFTSFKSCMPAHHHEHIQAAIDMLSSLEGDTNESGLQNSIRDVAARGRTLVLHVRAQNAGVLVTAASDGHIRFDTFELSATNKAVVGTKGRLLRSFPGAPVSIPATKMEEETFREAVAQALSSLSSQTVASVQRTAVKSGKTHVEMRDSCDPSMISEVLVNFLSAHGQPADSPQITKCTRDEVLWNYSLYPWHRSPRWLLIRVALHLTLRRATGSDALYKQAMLFVTSCMLQTAVVNLPSDVASRKDPFHRDMLHAMVAKIDWRLKKLGAMVETRIENHVQKVIDNAMSILKGAWTSVQTADARRLNMQSLRELDFNRDVNVAYPDLEKFLSSIGRRTSQSNQGTSKPSSGLLPLSSDVLPQLSFNAGFTMLNLINFENWVAAHSRKWVDTHWDEADACRQVETTMTRYHDLAVKSCADNPELLSAMHLTMAELWTALDIAATHKLPRLKLYAPAISYHPLESLLLPTKSQMHRLRKVEEYLALRKAGASRPWSKLYHDIENNESFAVQYFDQDSTLQRELDSIKKSATTARAQRVSELGNLKTKFQTLMQYVDTHECEEYEVTVRRYQRT